MTLLVQVDIFNELLKEVLVLWIKSVIIYQIMQVGNFNGLLTQLLVQLCSVVIYQMTLHDNSHCHVQF